MELVGLILIVLGIWGEYCAVNSFNPLTLLGAILGDPQNAQKTIDAAKQARDGSSYRGGATGQGNAGGGGGGGGGGGVSYLTGSGTYGYYSQFKINDTFQGHVARHSPSPGIDFNTPVGTALPTPFAGTVTFLPHLKDSTGNDNVVQVKLDNGDIFRLREVGSFASGLKNGQRVSAGTVVAYSDGRKGVSGSGNSSGPHVHLELQTPGGFIPFNQLLSQLLA